MNRKAPSPSPRGARALLLGTLLLASFAGACSASPDDEEESAQSDEELAAASHTTVDARHALVLHSALPATVERCRKQKKGPCTDADHDGLVDAWERLVLAKMRPAVEFDENEPLLKNPDHHLGMLARVNRGPHDGQVLVNILTLFSNDYGSTGTFCFHLSAHKGDAERVALDLDVDDKGDAKLVRAVTAAHEHGEIEHIHVYGGKNLRTLEYMDDPLSGEPRWRIFSSQNKHAMYATKAICENADFGTIGNVCFSEDCAADHVPNPKAYTRVPEFMNAGEPDHHLHDNLADLGFPGEKAWSEQDFCGGQWHPDPIARALHESQRRDCVGALRHKLVAFPFPVARGQREE